MKTITKPEGPVHNQKAARTLRRIHRRQIQIRRNHYESICNLPGGRRNPRLIQEVPIEVVLSSDDKDDPLPSDFNPDPVPDAEEPNSDCSLLNSTTSEKEAPEAQNNPPEAVPLLKIPRLSQEQLMALFDESSFSEEEEDDTVHIISPGGSQPPASPAPGDPRPASNADSSRYHPSTPIEDRMQETEESTEDEKPPMDPEELTRIARRILEATPPVSEADEPMAGPSRQAQ